MTTRQPIAPTIIDVRDVAAMFDGIYVHASNQHNDLRAVTSNALIMCLCNDQIDNDTTEDNRR